MFFKIKTTEKTCSFSSMGYKSPVCMYGLDVYVRTKGSNDDTVIDD